MIPKSTSPRQRKSLKKSKTRGIIIRSQIPNLKDWKPMVKLEAIIGIRMWALTCPNLIKVFSFQMRTRASQLYKNNLKIRRFHNIMAKASLVAIPGHSPLSWAQGRYLILSLKVLVTTKWSLLVDQLPSIKTKIRTKSFWRMRASKRSYSNMRILNNIKNRGRNSSNKIWGSRNYLLSVE